MKSIRHALLFLAVVMPINAFAQGAFVARGAYGALLGGDMMPGEARASYSAEIGWSFSGTLDAGIGYHWLEEVADTVNVELAGRSLEPRLTLHLIKQGITYPFSLSAQGRYAFSSLDSAPDAATEAEVHGRTWRAGGMLHTIVQLAEFVGLRPWTSINYVHSSHEYSFPDDSANLEINRGDTEYILGTQLIFMPTARSVLYLGPQLRFLRGDRTLGVSAGLVFN